MRESEINQIFQILKDNNPAPQTELKYRNHFTFLVAVVLSAQATDISVNKATKELFTICPTPELMLSIGIEKLKEYIKSIGLYNSKASNIIALCKVLIEQHNSQVPNNFESLTTLPGVGPKTANVVLNCLFDQPTIAVDTHVYRVARRIGLAFANTPIKVEQELMNIVPTRWQKDAHHWLILHGRYICKAPKPKCDICKISTFCNYYKQK